MPPPDSSGMDVGGPLRLRPLILPTTTPTTRPTTSSPTASAMSHTCGGGGPIATDVDDQPTATGCVPSFITSVKVTVFVWPAAKEATWLLPVCPSVDSQTVAFA